MIQFNLLPDVKMEYIRAERNKRLVFLVSGLVSAVSLAVFVVLVVGVMFVQKEHMTHLSSDIKKYSADLQGTQDLNKILTVQNQLNSLPSIHEGKADTNDVFKYVRQLTPTDASIATLTINFATDTPTMTITGSADSLETVNKFVDTLKFTEYKVDGKSEGKAFSNVVLSTFDRVDKGASYTINLSYVPDIFANNKNVELVVPDKVTTRSELEKPNTLFQPLTNGAGN